MDKITATYDGKYTVSYTVGKVSSAFRAFSEAARLFAGSPELLSACKFFLQSLESAKKGGLKPASDYSDWDTVRMVIYDAVAMVEADVETVNTRS